ncbi:MAG: hypothetical protein AB8H80_13725, partial [Planctomycetota bacterium]
MSDVSAADVAVAYLAPEGLLETVVEAVGDRCVAVRGSLVLAREAVAEAGWWAANTWLEPEWLSIRSIGDAAQQLRAKQRSWALHPVGNFRRAALIQEKLPAVRVRPREFPFEVPAAPMGGWTLWDTDQLLCSARCTSPFPGGVVQFVDDREGPPSRA